MRPSFTLWLAVLGCFVFTVTASAQSLVELAQKEKTRWVEIAKTGKTAEVIDAHALTTIDPTVVTAIEVTGSSQPSSPASSAELGRPPLENPNRAAALATTPSSTQRARRGALGRGWTRGGERPANGRGWSQRW